MEKVKCIVSYDGTNYKGFQRQKDVKTIQGEIERVLSIINKESVVIYGSGRTDAGVHALGQVIHFKTSLSLSSDTWQRAMNSLLPKDIYIRHVEKVDNAFHARFSATAKDYRYYIYIGEYNPLKSNYCYQHRHRQPLNVEAMRKGIKLLVGTHDFVRFSVKNELTNTVRTIYETDISEQGNLLELRFVGNGFLRGQVRVMVGTLIEIGEGKRDIESIQELLDGRREEAGKTAEPQGLYLYHVFYNNVR